MEKQEYTKEYFIKKFEAIPEELWITGSLEETHNGKVCHCALGHCSVNDMDLLNDESMALVDILKPIHEIVTKFKAVDGQAAYVFDINDRGYSKQLGSTPKERILNALKMVEDE